MMSKESQYETGHQIPSVANNSTVNPQKTNPFAGSLEEQAKRSEEQRKAEDSAKANDPESVESSEGPLDPDRLHMELRAIVIATQGNEFARAQRLHKFSVDHGQKINVVKKQVRVIEKELDERKKEDKQRQESKRDSSSDTSSAVTQAEHNKDSRPEIHIIGGQLPAMTDAAERALLADTSGSTVYQRDVQLVRAIRAANDSIDGHIRRQAGSLRIVPVDPAYLLERFTQAAVWLKFDVRSEKLRPTDAPKAVVDTYLSRVGRWNCPALTGIIEAPTLRPDGSILDVPGYDSVTGLIFDPGATQFEKIPTAPSLQDARRAVLVLKEVIKDFPFVAKHDEAVVLSAMLTALVRKSLRSAPLFGFSAPVMASGKSLLADCVSMIATGRRAPAWTYTGDLEEERKHITSALLAGDPAACIDNVSTPLESDRLCSVLTQETIEDRLLGVLKKVILSTAILWMVTGNNLEIRGDLSTRALVCKLDAKQENPEEREFQVNLFEWIPANRARLVTAALTILRAYHVAGRPKQKIKQFGRFETWSDWVRSALVWSGVADPCDARIQVAAADPTRQQLAALLSAWHAVFKEQNVTTADVTKAVRVTVTAGEETCSTPGGEELRQALLAVAGRGDVISSGALGRYLAKNQGRIIAGHQIEMVGKYGHAQKWQVRQVSSGVSGVSGVSANPLRASVNAQHFSEERSRGEEEKKYQSDTFGERADVTSTNSTNSINSPEQPTQGDGHMDSLVESEQPVADADGFVDVDDLEVRS